VQNLVRVFLSVPVLAWAPVALALSLDELAVWAGTGTNRAALVVAWPVPAPVSSGTNLSRPVAVAWAWGFRWNGTATAADLVHAVLQTDRRLFILTAAEVAGATVVRAVGLDANRNERFGLRGPQRWLLPEAFVAGPVSVTTTELQNLQPLEPGDWYAPADALHTWHVWREAGGQGGFGHMPVSGDWIPVGPALEECELRDGTWVALVWDATQSTDPSFPAAAAPGPVRPYTTRLLQAHGPFGASPYDDPTAVLGPPTRWFHDLWAVFSGRESMRRASVVEAPFHRDAPEGSPLLLTFPDGCHLIAEFDPPLTNDPAHPFGLDFLVFGNAFYVADRAVSDENSLAALRLTGTLFAEPLLVSVSPGYTGAPNEREDDPDTWSWYTYESGPFADTAFPTQAYLWDRDAGRWSPEPTDCTLPVNPALSELWTNGGWLATDVMKLYGRSAGGTGFDLTPSGFPAVRYVRIEGRAPDRAGGEVDAITRVRPLTVGEGLWMLPRNVAEGRADLWFQSPHDPARWAVQIRLLALNQPVWVSTAPAPPEPGPAPDSGCEVARVHLALQPFSPDTPLVSEAEARVRLPAGCSEDGRDLDVWGQETPGGVWTRLDFLFETAPPAVVVSGLTSPVTLVVVRISRPVLQITQTPGGQWFEFVSVPGWRHVLERTTDWRDWTVVRDEILPQATRVRWQDALAPAEAGFYRLRLSRR